MYLIYTFEKKRSIAKIYKNLNFFKNLTSCGIISEINCKRELCMAENMEVLKDLGLSMQDVSNHICERFSGIYVMDIKKHKIVVIKSLYKEEVFTEPVEKDWGNTIFEDFINLMSAKYRALALITFDREHLKKKFSDLTQSSEFIYQDGSEKWYNMQIKPLKIEDGDCTAVLVSIIDISEAKKKVETIARQMEQFHKGVVSSNWYFSQTAKDMYSEILKFDILSGETYKIVFEDDEPKDIPLMQCNQLYDKIFESIHPKDLEETRRVLSLDKIRAMNPGDVIEHSFRSYVNDKYHWYTVSVHVSEFEPSIAVIFARDITSSSVGVNQIMAKAEHDAVTGLFNVEKYACMIATEYSSLKKAGVIYVDIEGLASLNEKYGRDYGDEALKILAESIRSVQSRNALAYRRGDDEFMLVAVNVEKDELMMMLQLVKVRCARLCDFRQVQFFASFGSAWSDSLESVQALIADAVTDMKNNRSVEILH